MSLTLPSPPPATPRAAPHATTRAAAQSVVALPLPDSTWGAAEAREALAEARLALRLDLPEPTLVSSLTTVVLRSGEHAVKVYPPGTDHTHLARLTTALAGSASVLLPVADPVVTSSGVVSVSAWLDDALPVGWAAAGALLRTFHTEHADADVAVWEPLQRMLSQAEGLPDEAAEVLLAARTALLQELEVLRSPLGVGVVHGDVSPSNVMHRDGRPILIDLDFVARGPLEYDLGSAARRRDAGELDAATYRRFCEAYGADVRTWDGRVVLDRIAELGGVAFRLWDDRRQGRPLTWLADVVARWRTPL